MTKTVISPQKRLELIPFQPQKLSTNLGWSSIRLEDYRNLPPSNLSLAPMDHHIFAFHYKPPPGPLRHCCGSASSEDIMRSNDITYVPAKVDNQWEFGDGLPHCLHILIDDSFVARTASIKRGLVLTRAKYTKAFLFLWDN